jgi:hypothetical protein
MAIPVNPINMSGTAAFAGNSIGHLGLPVATYDNLAQAGKGFGDQMTASQQLGVQKQKMDIDNQNQQRLLAQTQSQIGIQQQDMKLKQDQWQNQLQQQTYSNAINYNQHQLETNATFAYSMMNVPQQEWEQSKGQYIQAGQAAGLINDQQAKNFMGMNYKQMQLQARMGVLTNKNALDLQKQQGFIAGGGSEVSIPTPNGPLTYKTIGNTQKNRETDSTDIGNDLAVLDQLKSSLDKYGPKYLTVGGKMAASVGGWLSASPLAQQGLKAIGVDPKPLIDHATGESEWKTVNKQLKYFVAKAYGNGQVSARILKQIDQDIPSSAEDPADYAGRVNGLYTTMKNAIQQKQNLLQEGIPLNSPAFDQLLDQRLQSMQAKMQSTNQGENSSPNNSQGQQFKITNDLVQQVSAKTGKSPDQVRQDMINKGWSQ